MQDHPTVRVKPPVVLLALIILSGLASLAKPKGMFRGNWARLIGLPFFLGGIGLAGASVRQMRAHGTHVSHAEPVNALVMEGPYQFSRNPIYVGMTLALVGLGFLANSFWFLPMAPLFMGILQTQVIRYEEGFLEARFGEAYRQYRENVRRWI